MSALAVFETPAPPPEGDIRVSEATTPAVPRLALRRDHVLPIFIVASLIVHATIILPSLLGMGTPDKATPREIPIELVQLPPPPAAKPKPAVAKPTPSKPQQQAAKPEPPKAAPKPPPKQVAQKKPEPPKPAPKPKQEAQKKPEPPKPAQKTVAERMRSLLPAASGAIAMPGASADGTDAVSYEDLVLSKVAKAKDENRHKGDPAAATVAFLLDDKGGVASAMITEPSGNAWLDDEAIAMIKRGAPYPPPPPGAKRMFQVTLTLHRVL